MARIYSTSRETKAQSISNVHDSLDNDGREPICRIATGRGRRASVERFRVRLTYRPNRLSAEPLPEIAATAPEPRMIHVSSLMFGPALWV